MLLLAAFVLWSFASIAWAEVQGTALDGANLALVYLLVYARLLGRRLEGRLGRDRPRALRGRARGRRRVVLLDAAGSPRRGALARQRPARRADRLSERGGGALHRWVLAGGPPRLAARGALVPARAAARRRRVPRPARADAAEPGGAAGDPVRARLLPAGHAESDPRVHLPRPCRSARPRSPRRPILDVFTVATDGGDVGAAFSAAADAMLIACVGLLLVGTPIGLLDAAWSCPRSTRADGGPARHRAQRRRGRRRDRLGRRRGRQPGRLGRTTAGRTSRATTTRGASDSRASAAISAAAAMTSGGRPRRRVRGRAGARRGRRQLRGRLPRAPRHRRGAVLSAQPSDPAPRRDRDRRHAPVPRLPRRRRGRRLPDQARAPGSAGAAVAAVALAAAGLLPPPQQRRLALDVRRRSRCR